MGYSVLSLYAWRQFRVRSYLHSKLLKQNRSTLVYISSADVESTFRTTLVQNWLIISKATTITQPVSTNRLDRLCPFRVNGLQSELLYHWAVLVPIYGLLFCMLFPVTCIAWFVVELRWGTRNRAGLGTEDKRDELPAYSLYAYWGVWR